MSLITEMKRQTAARMALLGDLQLRGLVTTPIGYLRAPALLVKNMGADALAAQHARLKRTRKRVIVFGLNGRAYVVPRSDALALVRAEVEARGFVAEPEGAPS